MTEKISKFAGTFLFLLLIPIFCVRAAVIINEILPNPAGNDKDNPTGEFVELYNNGNNSVNLSNWTIKDDKDQTFSEISPGTLLSPNSYLIFHSSKSILNNGGDSARLYDASNNLVESVTYPTSPDGQSYSRTNSAWEWSQPSPSQPNQTSSSNQILNDNTDSTNDENTPSESSDYTQNINISQEEDQTPILVSQSGAPDPMPSSPVIKTLPQEQTTKNETSDSEINTPQEQIASKPQTSQQASAKPTAEENKTVLTEKSSEYPNAENAAANLNQSTPVSFPTAIIIALLTAIFILLLSNRFKKS